MKRYVFPIFLVITLALSVIYFVSSKKQENVVKKYWNVIQACTNLCIYAKNKGLNLSSQCLSDLYPNLWRYKGWVCDVAHWPRLEIDNKPENQCKNFGRTAYNFVEVDPECKPIRIFVYGETPEPVVIKLNP